MCCDNKDPTYQEHYKQLKLGSGGLTPLIPAPRKLRQEDWEFQASLGKVVRLYINTPILRREGEEQRS